MFKARVVCALAAVLVSSACTVTVPGSAAVSPTTPPPTSAAPRTKPVDPQKMTAEAVFGDLLFVELCDFLEPEDLKSFGKAEYVVGAAFDACGIDITRADGSVLEVTVGDLDFGLGSSDPESTDLAGGLRSVPLDKRPGSCVVSVEFPDDVSMSVDVYGPDATDDVCPVVHKAIEAMVGRFPEGIVSTREIPSNSLARVDACAVLPESAAADVPGIRKTGEHEVLTKHVCEIGSSSDSAPYLSLQMLVGYPPPSDEYATETIAGRKTLVYQAKDEPENGLVTCSVITDHQRIDTRGLVGTRELAVVSVWVKEADAQRGCPQGKAIAAKVWPKLPPAE
jgi:hypothetical protein